VHAAKFRDGHRHYHRVAERMACAHAEDSSHGPHDLTERSIHSTAFHIRGGITVMIFPSGKKVKPTSCLENLLSCFDICDICLIVVTVEIRLLNFTQIS